MCTNACRYTFASARFRLCKWRYLVVQASKGIGASGDDRVTEHEDIILQEAPLNLGSDDFLELVHLDPELVPRLCMGRVCN